MNKKGDAMKGKAESLQARIQNLQASFLQQLPTRLQEARRAFLNSEGGTLHRILHSLKGTGNSFGFRDLGAQAEIGEHLLEKLLKAEGQSDPELVNQIEVCLDLLDDIIEKLILGKKIMPIGSPDLPDQSGAGARSEGKNNRAENLILICDDDRSHAELIGSQLRYFGYCTKVCCTKEELQTAVLEDEPAVCIMDIMFPQNSSGGAKMLGELRAKNIIFPAIFVSDRTDFEARILAIRSGGAAYFQKPTEAMELLGSLDILCTKVPSNPYRILIMDDELEIAQYHSLILENAGMIVQIVLQPKTILEAVKSFNPDLVLMDMYMPSYSGREVAALIRQIPEFLSLPIIFLSGETDKTKQFSAMTVGVEGFLTKPVVGTELVNSVLLRAERMRSLQSLMTRDSLTGLLNHTTTTQMLDSALHTAKRSGIAMCFAMIDLDRFKLVNDSYGHPTGDQVLLAMARVLRQRLRTSDVIGRYGGEEFAVILGNVEIDTAWELMDSLREDFSRVIFPVAGGSFSCTFSCGVADSKLFDGIEALREAADKALYRAKNSGRNRVEIAVAAGIEG